MRGIIPGHALEKPQDDSEKALRVQAAALGFLARLVRGGVNVRIVTPAHDDNIIPPETKSFSLIEYQDGRRGALVATISEDKHLVMARENDSGFTHGSDNFDAAWEDPSTIKARQDVMDYLFDTATRLEE